VIIFQNNIVLIIATNNNFHTVFSYCSWLLTSSSWSLLLLWCALDLSSFTYVHLVLRWVTMVAGLYEFKMYERKCLCTSWFGLWKTCRSRCSASTLMFCLSPINCAVFTPTHAQHTIIFEVIQMDLCCQLLYSALFLLICAA
jgi:hypothetical protein